MTAHVVDVPAWLRPVARKAGTGKWVKKKRLFKADFYFTAIHQMRENWQTSHGEEAPDEVLAGMIGLTIDKVGDLKHFATKEQIEVGSEKEWADMIDATAWHVVERYYKLVEKGKWP